MDALILSSVPAAVPPTSIVYMVQMPWARNVTTIRDSICTTIQVQDDLSNYWAPSLYHYDPNQGFSLILGRFSIYYQFVTTSFGGSQERYPFPEGLTMLAGDMMQRKINESDSTSTASNFQCQRNSGDSPYSHDIRDFQESGMNCDAQLRGTTRFPSCRDGIANNTDRVSSCSFLSCTPKRSLLRRRPR